MTHSKTLLENILNPISWNIRGQFTFYHHSTFYCQSCQFCFYYLLQYLVLIIMLPLLLYALYRTFVTKTFVHDWVNTTWFSKYGLLIYTFTVLSSTFTHSVVFGTKQVRASHKATLSVAFETKLEPASHEPT